MVETSTANYLVPILVILSNVGLLAQTVILASGKALGDQNASTPQVLAVVVDWCLILLSRPKSNS